MKEYIVSHEKNPFFRITFESGGKTLTRLVRPLSTKGHISYWKRVEKDGADWEKSKYLSDGVLEVTEEMIGTMKGELTKKVPLQFNFFYGELEEVK